MTVILRPAHLKVASALLTDIAAGLLLLTLTVTELGVLTTAVGFATFGLVLAIKTEILLEEL